ncbi:MAG: hypothetical protein J1F04_07060 [Oscillospiraceae bacterium]|nr:hypothetical protein [Oscillospiraceae bacterium]
MPFDIDKPVSSKLDIEDTNVSDVISGDFSFDMGDDGEIYPSRNSKTKFVPPTSSDNTVIDNVDIPDIPVAPVAPDVPVVPVAPDAPVMPTMPSEQITPTMPSISSDPNKVNLEKPKKATQMPAVRADANQPPVVPWKSTDDLAPRAQSTIDTPYSINARENNQGQPRTKAEKALDRRLLGKGTIRLAMSDTKNIVLMITAVATTLAVWFIANNLFLTWFAASSTRTRSRATATVIVFVVGLFLFFFNMIRSGEHWNYVASGREMIFSRKGRASDIIFYKDVVSVDYRPYKFLGIIETGYTVNVLTYGKRYEFRYVYPNLAHKISFENTPFEIIRKQIDQLGLNNA